MEAQRAEQQRAFEIQQQRFEDQQKLEQQLRLEQQQRFEEAQRLQQEENERLRLLLEAQQPTIYNITHVHTQSNVVPSDVGGPPEDNPPDLPLDSFSPPDSLPPPFIPSDDFPPSPTSSPAFIANINHQMQV
jgi:hypothetical protein